MRLSVVIATFNGRAKVQRCLSSLIPQAEATDVEVVVVIDGSTDGTELVLAPLLAYHARFLNAVVRPHEGVSAARNYGVVMTRGDWLLFLDDDTVLPPKFLRDVLVLLEVPGADLIGLKDLPLKDDGYLAKSIRHLETASRLSVGRGFALKGAALLCRRTVFEGISGFDVDRGYYGGEDTDLVERARAGGSRLAYLQRPFVFHQSPTFPEYTRRSWRALNVNATFAGRRYYRVEETLVILVSAAGAILAMRRYPSLIKPGIVSGVAGVITAGTMASKLAGSGLVYVPGIVLAAGIRIPFMILGSATYLARTVRSRIRGTKG